MDKIEDMTDEELGELFVKVGLELGARGREAQELAFAKFDEIDSSRAEEFIMGLNEWLELPDCTSEAEPSE